MKEKVVLAYSGGLDTTAIIPWLKENFDYEVICVCVNCGQAEELDGLEAPQAFALSSRPSNSLPCPQLMQQQITSYPKFSFNHGITAVVSRPPE